MKSKVLLTGGSGFLGSAVAKLLKKQGYDVWSTTRIKKKIFSNEIYWDLEEAKNLSQKNDLPIFDLIIHLACKIDLGANSLKDMLVPNVLATKEIADLALKQGAFLIFSSTAIVHGSKSKIITKKTSLNCDTPYAESKARAEEEIQKTLTQYCILRLGGIFWKNGPPHLGLNRAIDDVLVGKNPTFTASGSAQRNYISVNDAARVIAYICNWKIKGVHLCAGSSILSIKSMLDLACEILNPGRCFAQQIEGPEAQDQIIEVSQDLPVTGSFKNSMREILL